MAFITIGQEEQLHIPFQTMDSPPRGVEHVMGCCRRPFWDCISLTMGCLGKKSEVEKGMDSDDLGRNNSEKIKVRGDEQSWKCVNSSLCGRAPTRVIKAHGWVVLALAESGSLCQQLGWTVGLGPVTRESPVSDTLCQPQVRPGPEPVCLQCSTGSQCGCASEWVGTSGVSWGQGSVSQLCTCLYMCVCECRSEHQQAEWSCGPTCSHDQEPATGEAGIQEHLLGRRAA